MNSFLTGSYAYGIPNDKSDVDIVVLLSVTHIKLLMKHADKVTNKERAQTSDFDGTLSSASLRFGKLNLICCTTKEQYECWKEGTEELIRQSVMREREFGDETKITREKACEYFKKLRKERIGMNSSCILLYLSAIVVANYLVSTYGQAALPFTAFVLIPFDLVTRDALHEKWRDKALWPKMFLLVSAGSLLSYFSSMATAQVSLASALAFGTAGLIDVLVYWVLDKRSRFIKMNSSNFFAAITDSLVFPLVAFGVIVPSLSFTQAASKFVGGIAWSLVFLVLMKKRKSNAYLYTNT